jgi:hypothetical protein
MNLRPYVASFRDSVRKEGRAARPGVIIQVRDDAATSRAGPESSAHFDACRFGVAFYKAAYSLRRLRSAFYPVIDPFTVQLNISRITAGIIITNRFDEAAIALRTLFGDDNSIERLFLRASSS